MLGQGCAFDKAGGGEHRELPPTRRLVPTLLLVFTLSLLFLLCAHSVPLARPPAEGQSVMLLKKHLCSFDKFSVLNWLLFFLFVLHFVTAWKIPHCSVPSHAVSTFASFMSEMHFCSKARGNWVHKREIPHRHACEMATCFL